MLCLCLCGAAPASAQAPGTGPWVSLGGGLGSAQFSCDCGALEFDRVTGFSGFVRGGWTVSERLRVGAEFNLWRRPREETQPESAYRLSSVTAIIAYYPSANGLFVRAGAGLGFVAGDVDLYKGIMLDRSKGIGAIAGVGYDIPIGRRVSLTPAASLWYANVGDLRNGADALRSGWSQHVFDITVGLTLR